MEKITAQEYDELQGEINGLENLLTQTDYIALKMAEGKTTNEEYADKLASRQEWRQKIHELRDKLNNSVVEDDGDTK